MTSAISVSAMACVYDLENEKYRSYVDTLTESPREEDLLFLVPEIDEMETKHIYNIYDDTDRIVVYEYGNETTRFFSSGNVTWSG
ncbi:MAG: hypothetical protein E7508_02420 [Ruminococcus sp.]|nr:hypothetical protein [Ruminococcus sp.]